MLSLNTKSLKNKFPSRTRSGLAPRLILYILLFSSVVTFFATALQLYFDYSRDVHDIDVRLSQVKDSYMKSITLSLWSMDYEQLQAQLEGIQVLPDMQYLEIEFNGKPLLTVGNIKGNNLLRKSYRLTHHYRNQDIYLGTLHVAASLDGVYDRLRDRVLVIFGSQAIKTFLVTSFIFLIFQILVTRHLQRISHHLRSKRIGILPFDDMNPLVLNRKPSPPDRQDELDDVVHAFNDMYSYLITSYKQLAESRERLDLAMRGANDGLWDWNVDAGTAYYSPRWKHMLGYEDRELEGSMHTWFDRIHPEDFERTTDALQQHLENHTNQFECMFRLRHKDGTYRWVLSRGQAQWNIDGTPHRIVGTHVDISAQKEAESALEETTRAYRMEQEQRLKAERLACLGELSASIAHEIRNPLSSIINSLALLTKGPLEEEDRHDVIDIVNHETHRLQRILNDFLSFSRLRQSDMHAQDLISTLNEAVALLRLSLPEDGDIELSTQFHSTHCIALFDKDQLCQVILNLGLNAIQAMPNGGKLVIATRVSFGCLWISATDNGTGISEEMKDKIVKPFFTNRENGTGLGLPMAIRILSQHNTDLCIDSEQGKGTTMQFSLKMA